MDSSERRAQRKLVLILDACLVLVSMLLAYHVQSALRTVVPQLRTPPPFGHYVLLSVLTTPLWAALIAALRLHRVMEQPMTMGQIFTGLLKLHCFGLIALAMLLFLTQTLFNRSLMALFLGSSFLVLFLERATLSRWALFQHQQGQSQQRLLLVGDPSQSMLRFVENALAAPLPAHIVGVLAAERPTEGALPASTRYLGGVDELARVLHDEAVDGVLFFPPVNRPAEVPQLLQHCEELGVSAEFAVELVRPLQAIPRVITLHEHPFISFEVSPKPPELLAIKHAADFVLAAIALLVLAPLMLATALCIWLTMRRPLFYLQERAGLYGRKFRMIKFRTMVRDAEAHRDELLVANEMSGPVFKLNHDPRVTRLGRILRRSSIDELPQLFNVLRGEMSLVGPRPLPLVEQREIYGWQRRRLSMKPGITGLWQVSGRSEVDFEQWMRLDLRYVDRWSLLLDLKILLKTIPTVFFGRGAR